MEEENSSQKTVVSIQDEIARHNASVEAEESGQWAVSSEQSDEVTEVVEVSESEIKSEAEADTDAVKKPDDGSDGESEPERDSASPEKKTEEGEEAAKDEETALLESLKSADVETLAATSEKVLARYELPADVKAIIDRQAEHLAELQSKTQASSDALEAGAAIDKLYNVEFADGELKPNAAPFVDYIFDKMRNEVPAIAQEIFERDSVKYPGMSVFQEKIVDHYENVTPQKLAAIDQYLSANAPLPRVQASRPSFVDERITEAWNDLPEPKRFSVESIAGDLAELEKFLADADEYYKPDLEKEVVEKRQELNVELGLIAKAQAGIDYQKAQRDTETRQAQENFKAFAAKVNTAYSGEIFELADKFVVDLAPKLTFVDESMQTSMARNMLTRVQNALAFNIEPDGSFSSNPYAEYYAKQLADEGVKIDFKADRALLQKHYAATVKIEILKEQKASPKAVENAEREKRAVMNDIRAAYTEALGQIGRFTSASANKAIEGKVAEIAKKKTISRITPKGEAAAVGKQPATRAEIDKEIADWNRNIKDGDDLYNALAV